MTKSKLMFTRTEHNPPLNVAVEVSNLLARVTWGSEYYSMGLYLSLQNNGYDHMSWGILTESDQIKKMNEFFRKTLVHISDTTTIRSWLEDIDSISEYVQNFEREWGQLYISSGALG